MTRRAMVRSVLFGAAALGMAAARFDTAAQEATPAATPAYGDPLPSWADGPLKQRMLAYVADSVTKGHPGYLPPNQRVATFDIDGTLVCEYPAPMQAYFAVDMVRQIGEADAESARAPVFQRVLAGEFDDLTTVEPPGFLEVFDAVNGDMTQQRFVAFARRWLQFAIHPVTGKRFIDMVYQPQLEWLAHLRANGFATFLVSAGSVDVVRAYSLPLFDIPTWRVIGTSYDYEFAVSGGKGQVVGTSQVVALTNKASAIGLHVGERPVIAVGNSDADLPMLQYANGAPTPVLPMLVHHTDAEREFAYDRDYSWSPLVAGLSDAQAFGFGMIDMKTDWLRIWPEEPSPPLLASGN